MAQRPADTALDPTLGFTFPLSTHFTGSNIGNAYDGISDECVA